MEATGVRTVKPYVILSGANTETTGVRTIKPYCHSERSKYGNDGFKNNKALCHSERSDSAAEESSRRRIIKIIYASPDSSASPRMTYKVGQSKP